MAKLTWLGTEDYREGETPLESCTWCGVLFTAFDKVEVTDEWMIAKARGNRFFKVEEEPEPQTFFGPEPPPSYIPAPDPPRITPEMWTNDPATDPQEYGPNLRYPAIPVDYPPEDEPDREPNKKRRGRPPRVRENGDVDQ